MSPCRRAWLAATVGPGAGDRKAHVPVDSSVELHDLGVESSNGIGIHDCVHVSKPSLDNTGSPVCYQRLPTTLLHMLVAGDPTVVVEQAVGALL